MVAAMVQAERDAERKGISTLRVLSGSSEPLGLATIARELGSHGVHLSERAVWGKLQKE
jgi:repressor of nif and glnA expression